jgi:hypothetical protein
VVATSTSAEHEHDKADEDLLPLGKLIWQTPGAHPIGSADELGCNAFETNQELSEFLAFVSRRQVASRSFKGLFPPRLAALSAGRQPLLTIVTIGELTQWTNLR